MVSAEIDSLDPQRSYLPGVWNLMRLYTRTLVTYSSEPGHTDELVPDLATDLGTPSEDGLSWTFTLREGVRFENGRPITSRDVKYGIERSFASDVIVGGPTYVVDLLDDPGNQYAGPVPGRGGGQARACRRSRPPTTATIVFKLRAPQPDLPFVMALPSSSPVPIEADTGAGYGADPVSSGPYAITSVDPATGILLDRNPQWDPATDDVRTALPDQVVVRTGLSGRGAGPGAAGRLGRPRHHRHRRAGGDHGAARPRTRTTRCATGWTTSPPAPSGCSPCRPTSPRWTTPTAGPRWPRSVDRQGGADGARRPGQRRPPLAAVAPRPARRAPGRATRGRPRRRPGRT